MILAFKPLLLVRGQVARGCSSVWLERPPVTRKVVGSSPISPASLRPYPLGGRGAGKHRSLHH